MHPDPLSSFSLAVSRWGEVGVTSPKFQPRHQTTRRCSKLPIDQGQRLPCAYLRIIRAGRHNLCKQLHDLLNTWHGSYTHAAAVWLKSNDNTSCTWRKSSEPCNKPARSLRVLPRIPHARADRFLILFLRVRLPFGSIFMFSAYLPFLRVGTVLGYL